MRRLFPVIAGGLRVGELPRGCQLCLQGAKLVVFVTGKCSLRCYYCPISDERKANDTIYANEKPADTLQDIIAEAELCDALGASITGGEPLEVFPKTIEIIRGLREHFGPTFHIHMYTGIKNPSSRQLSLLQKAGLDEIRFHKITEFSDESILRILESPLAVGAEIPAIPSSFNDLKETLLRIEEIRTRTQKHPFFLNLNELEISETNYNALHERGFHVRSNSVSGVAGSAEVGRQTVRWIASHLTMNAYYCPSQSKDSVQLRRRFLRRANNIKHPYEHISKEGLLIKGVLQVPHDQALEPIQQEIIRQLGLSQDMIAINNERHQIEFQDTFTRQIAFIFGDRFTVGVAEEHPTYSRLQTSFTPVRRRQ